MIMATCAGTLAGSRPAASAAEGRLVIVAFSNLQQLGFFRLRQVVDLHDVLVHELLHLVRSPLLLVLGDRILLVLLLSLQPLDRIVADAAHGDAARLRLLVHLLDEVLAPLFIELRNVEADVAAVVVRRNAHLRLLDALLDRAQRVPVERGDQKLARLRHGHRRDLVERKLLAVHLDAHVLQDGGAGAARADKRELMPRDLDGLLHLLFGLCEKLRDHGFNPPMELFLRLTTHDGSDRLAEYDPTDIAGLADVEHYYRDIVLAAERKRRLIHDAQVLDDALVVGDGGVADGVRMLAGVFVVNAIHVGRFEDRVRSDFVGAKRGGGVRREEGVPGAAGQHDDAALLQVAYGAPANERLRDLGHGDRAHDSGLNALLLKRILQRHAVDDGPEHAHIVGAGSLHASFGSALAADDVSGADHNGDLDAGMVRGDDFGGDRANSAVVQPYPWIAGGRRRGGVRIGRERLPGELEQHAPPAEPAALGMEGAGRKPHRRSGVAQRRRLHHGRLANRLVGAIHYSAVSLIVPEVSAPVGSPTA